MAKSAKPHFFRNTLLTGLLILIPLTVTYLLIAFLFGLLSNVGAPFFSAFLQLLNLDRFVWIKRLEPTVNLLLSLVIVFLLGLVGTNIIGRRILARLDGLVLRLPLASTIYGAVKQMVEMFQGPGRSFQRVVLIQYPRKGLWMMGFVAQEWPDTLNLADSDMLLAVFIPTTPNPTSGFLVMAAQNEVVHLDFSVEDAFKFIVTSGAIGRAFALER